MTFCFGFQVSKKILNENYLDFHMSYRLFLHYGWFLQNLEKDFIPTLLHTTVTRALFGRYYITKRTRQILQIQQYVQPFWWLKSLVVIISYCLLSFQVIFMSIKSKRLEFFQNSKNLPYEYLDSILLITQKPGHFSASPLGYTLNISKCKK